MKDNFGRDITYLRVSVTERCNLNCVYCGKDACDKRESELPAADVARIVRAFVSCGITKVRLTGGEPLVRNDIIEIVSRLHAIPQIRKLSLTTNGVLLPEYAQPLADAGLDSVNVSLDSTDEHVYRHMTGANVLHRVLDGIAAAQRAGLSPIRLNAVLLRDVNRGSADDLIALAREMPVDVRFTELMPFSDAGADASQIVTADEILADHPALAPAGEEDGPARYYTAPGFRGRVGFISPISRRFCASCNRMRLLADGRIKPCLGYDTAIDLKPFLNAPGQLEAQVRQSILQKPAGHHFGDGGHAHGLNRTGG